MPEEVSYRDLLVKILNKNYSNELLESLLELHDEFKHSDIEDIDIPVQSMMKISESNVQDLRTQVDKISYVKEHAYNTGSNQAETTDVNIGFDIGQIYSSLQDIHNDCRMILNAIQRD